MLALCVPGSRFRVRSSPFRVQNLGVTVHRSVGTVQEPDVRVQGSGFERWGRTQVQGSGLRVQGSRFREQGRGNGVEPADPPFESGSGFHYPGFGFRVSDFGVRVSGFEVRVLGSRFREPGFGLRDPGLGIRVSGGEFRVSGFGLRPKLGTRRAFRIRIVSISPRRIVACRVDHSGSVSGGPGDEGVGRQVVCRLKPCSVSEA